MSEDRSVAGVRKRVRALRAANDAACMRALDEAFDALWQHHQDIEAVAWFQYTPSYDGEGVPRHCQSPLATQIGGTWHGEDAELHRERCGGVVGQLAPHREDIEALQRLVTKMAPILERVHGDDVHVCYRRQSDVRVTRDEVPWTWTASSRSDEWI